LRCAVTAFIASTFGLICAAPAVAAPGTPDLSFGNAGFTVVNEPSGTFESFDDVLVLPDGKLIAAGAPASSSGFLLARFDPNGVLDPTFGTGGITIQPDTGADGDPQALNALEFDQHGRILAAGLGQGAANAAGFARYLPSGLPDPSFSLDGINVVPCAAVSCSVDDVSPAPDGGVYAIGDTPATDQVVIIKLLENGTPDPNFNADGIRFLNLAGVGEQGRAIETLADGSVVLGGPAEDGVFLAHMSSTGALIPGLGPGGVAYEEIGTAPGPNDSLEDIEIVAGGRIVAAGYADEPGNDDALFVARFSASGDLDASFSGTGVLQRSPTGRRDVAQALAIDASGRIVVVAQTGVLADPLADIWLARLSSEGVLDPSFGAGGETLAGIAGGADLPRGLALQPDGAAVVVGQVDGPIDGELEIARFTGDPVAIPDPDASCKGKPATIVAAMAGGKLAGTEDADVIVGSTAADTISSGSGDDLICAGRGKDKLKGAAGKDKLVGDAGKDKLGGGSGKDRLVGGPGKDALNGGGGNDRCTGGPGRDVETSC
jgi:uncharacterized delta-60 repeat protein